MTLGLGKMENDKQLEAIYCVPDEVPMVQVFRKHGDGELVAEILYAGGELTLQPISNSILPVDEIMDILRLANDRLSPPQEEAQQENSGDLI